MYIKQISVKFLFLLTILPSVVFSQKMIPDNFCISNHEKILFDNINKLRQDYEKPEVQLST